MCMCMYACECVYARGWVGVLLYMHVHVYVCTYVHMYTRDFILKYTFLNAAGLSCHCVLSLLRDCGCDRLEGCVVWERAKWRFTTLSNGNYVVNIHSKAAKIP